MTVLGHKGIDWYKWYFVGYWKTYCFKRFGCTTTWDSWLPWSCYWWEASIKSRNSLPFTGSIFSLPFLCDTFACHCIILIYMYVCVVIIIVCIWCCFCTTCLIKVTNILQLQACFATQKDPELKEEETFQENMCYIRVPYLCAPFSSLLFLMFILFIFVC